MAIDGIKIIDSDLASDVYNQFMDLYDANVDVTAIKNKTEEWRDTLTDGIEFEIFITSYALALWETGCLSESILEEVRQVISQGHTIQMWSEEATEAVGKERGKELSKLLKKISVPKINPRKRKKYTKITRFLFDMDDIISFKMPDGTYRAAVLFDISQHRGACIYAFTPTDYEKLEPPTKELILNCSVFINKLRQMFDRAEVIKKQPGIEWFWERDTKVKTPYTIGLTSTGIDHKDLIKFKDRFTVIGNIRLKDSFRKYGSQGYESTFELYASGFENLTDHYVRAFRFEMIELKHLLE